MQDHQFQQRQGNRLVIGVTGHIGAGKTSVASYLKATRGFFYVRYSGVLSDWLAEDPDSKAHLQTVGWEVMGGGMQAELNARLIAQIPSGEDCAVDGLRHPIDFECLSNAFPSEFYLLFIECAQETRWQRVRTRYPQLEDFRRADSHPVEQQTDALRRNAFGLIDNDGSLHDLYSRVDQLLEKMHLGEQQ
jgi:dephospho-CoA kinase